MLISLTSCIKFSSGEPTFPVYGNWCGPNYPAKGKNPAPIDVVDEACKKHDLCYRDIGMFEKSCDEMLISTLKNTETSTKKQAETRKLILSYFKFVDKNRPE